MQPVAMCGVEFLNIKQNSKSVKGYLFLLKINNI
jgi:hypothetical protein